MSRMIDVFFYGLFMDENLLREKKTDPLNRRIAFVENYSLAIGARATMVPQTGSIIYGVLYSMTSAEIDMLYSDESVRVYRPEAVLAKTKDGGEFPALCFNLPEPPSTEERNPQYASKLKELAARIGLPRDYVSSIQ